MSPGGARVPLGHASPAGLAIAPDRRASCPGR